MERLRLEIARTNSIVLNALNKICDIDGNYISIYKDSNRHNRSLYLLDYSEYFNGEKIHKKMFLSEKDYRNLLRLGLSLKGYKVKRMDFLSKGKTKAYQVLFDVTDSGIRKRKK